MGHDVYANGRSISSKSADGKSLCAFPDVCLTPPAPPAGPIPVPYPNTGMASDTTRGTRNVKIAGKEIMLKNRSFFRKSTGDEAATRSQGMNVVTHQIKGKVYFVSWSMNVKFEGENVVRHLDLTTHNHASDPPGTPPTGHTDKQTPPVAEKETCDPHAWVRVSQESPADTKAKNDNARGATKQEDAKRGYAFENKAIDANMVEMNIQATSAVFKCSKCGAEQEVDIVGDRQLGEAKSKSAKQVKKKGSQQARNYRSIQAQVFGEGTQPRAKLDGERGDHAETRAEFERRGFQVEIVN